jgi:hypothetical protein
MRSPTFTKRGTETVAPVSRLGEHGHDRADAEHQHDGARAGEALAARRERDRGAERRPRARRPDRAEQHADEELAAEP